MYGWEGISLMNEYKAYGLELFNIQSKVEVLEQKIRHYEMLEEIFANYNLKDGYIVAYLNYEVKIGILREGKISFYANDFFAPKYLLKLRAFNRVEEILIWKEDGDLYNIRYRNDGEGKNMKVVQADQVLWGTKSKPLEQGWVKLYESRGTELIMPKPQKSLYNYGDNWVKIRTRNYIDFNKLGQAEYIDSRFVNFV